jgi:formate dehydrogenase major subunit
VLPGWQLISAIAERAGARWRYDSAADVMAEIARLTPAYAGITHERLRGRFGIQWPCDARCPDGTARLAVDGPQARLRFAPLSPDYRTPPVTEEYPTLLLVGEAQHYWHQNNLMRKTHIPRREYDATLLQYPRGYVAISPEHARELKVRDGAMVRIASPYGAMEAMVRVSDAMRMDTAYVACFVSDMVDDFLLAHRDLLRRGEDAAIAVRMVKL